MPFNPKDRGIHKHAADGGKDDIYVAKVSADGNTLIYGTYIGGNDYDEIDTHQMAVDSQGNAYIDFSGNSTDLPTTEGVLQPTFPKGPNSNPLYLCKIGPDGALLLGTYLPTTSFQQPEGLSVDAANHVYLTGTTHSADFPVTAHAFQKVPGGETRDYLDPGVVAACSGFLTVVAADFKSVIYSTFVGQGASLIAYNPDGSIKHFNAYGGFHANTVAPDGSFIAVGSWLSDGLPRVNAYQVKFYGGPAKSGDYVKHCDAAIVRFVPVLKDSSAPAESPARQ
jgi:hypothetical protein